MTYDDAGALDIARAAVVREHLASEDRHELDATIATVSHPRDELIATGEVFDGALAQPLTIGRATLGHLRRRS
jgi:hypothetical protein